MELEELKVLITANAEKATEEINQVKHQLKSMSSSTNEASNQATNGLNKIGSMVSSVGKKVAIAFGVTKVVEFGKSCLELGSDLQEVQNVVDVTFPTMSNQIDDFAKKCMTSAGLSETMAKKYLGTFGSMAEAFGYTEQQSASMAEQLTQLTGDVASFYNISQDEAYTKLKSVFSGETETLKDLGVVMTQNALDQYAMANGYGKTTNAMSEQEKVALRLAFVQDKLKNASGDFERTSDSWANQTRILSLQFQSLKANIGQGLIAVLTPVIKVINTIMAKLVTMANLFRTIMQRIMGISASGTGGNSKGGIAGKLGLGEDNKKQLNDLNKGIGNVGSGVSNVGKQAEGAGKKAKKAIQEVNRLLKLDEINNLNKDNSNDDDTGGAGVGDVGGVGDGMFSGLDTTPLDDANSKLDDMSDMFDYIIDKVKYLGELFARGFSFGFGDFDFSEILSDLENIGNKVIDIFTDPDVLNAGAIFGEHLIYDLGVVAGSVVRVGANIAQGLIGGISDFLDKEGERIKEHIISVFNIKTEIIDQVADTFKAIGDLSDVLGSESMQNIVGDLISIFTECWMGFEEIIYKLGRDAINLLTQPFIDNEPAFKDAIQALIDDISSIADILLDFVQTAWDTIQDIYDNHVQPLFESLTNGISEIISTFLDGWNTYITPVIDNIVTIIEDVYTNHIEPLVGKIGDVVGKIIDFVKMLWEEYLQPFVDWIVKNIIPPVSKVCNAVAEIVGGLASSIGDIMGDIMDVLGGIIDFITGVFSGNWSRAWNGIKQIFGGIWDAMVNIVKAPINLIIGCINGMIGAINTAIRGINHLHIDIPDWVPGIGGNRWGFNFSEIGRISYLAKGGIVDKATPAIVGEAGKEAVMPLENNTGWITELASKITERGNMGGKQPITIKLYQNGLLTSEQVIDDINDVTKTTGECPIVL